MRPHRSCGILLAEDRLEKRHEIAVDVDVARGKRFTEREIRIPK